MRHKLVTVALVALLATVGCASLRPDADPILVRAEQTLAVSFSTVDAFLRLEHTVPADLEAVVPQAPIVAEHARRVGPAAFRALEAAIAAYRTNRTPENEAGLMTWLAVVEELASQARLVLAAWRGGAL